MDGAGLNLLPATSAVPRTSTWGGAVVAKATGSAITYHMMFSLLTHHCGINSWLQNSIVGHATSATLTPAAQFAVTNATLQLLQIWAALAEAGPNAGGDVLQPPRADDAAAAVGGGGGGAAAAAAAFSIFSHEPTLAAAPDGQFALFFTHNAGPVTRCGTCTSCTSGNSTPDCPPDWDKNGRDPQKELKTYFMKTSDFEHWSAPVPVPQANRFSDTAFSATILRNGTLIAMTRTQVIVGTNWSAPETYKVWTNFSSANKYGEGADLWHDESTGTSTPTTSLAETRRYCWASPARLQARRRCPAVSARCGADHRSTFMLTRAIFADVIAQ